MCPACLTTLALIATGATSTGGVTALVVTKLRDHRDSIHHVFCKHCGVRPFGWGDDPTLDGKFYAVHVSCLEGVEIDELVNAPITYFDGRNDNYKSPPAETRHL